MTDPIPGLMKATVRPRRAGSPQRWQCPKCGQGVTLLVTATATPWCEGRGPRPHARAVKMERVEVVA